MERTFYVHIRASRRNGTLYVGVTGDLPRRAYEPREGLIGGFARRWLDPPPHLQQRIRRPRITANYLSPLPD